MKGGKKKLADRPVDWKISLPTAVTAPVALILSDPLTGLPKHGARSKLIESLLREWLVKQAKGAIQLAPEEDTDVSSSEHPS